MANPSSRVLLIIATGVVLAACAQHDDALDAARAAEVAAHQLEAQSIDEVDPADISAEGGWEQIGPGVWRLITRDEAGRPVGERVSASGHAAFEWLARVYFPARLETLTAALAETTTPFERIVAQDQINSAERFIAAIERWASEHRDGSPIAPLQSCTPTSSASAARTTASPGAKAYASGRNCSHVSTGWVDAYSFAGGNQDSSAQDLAGFGATGSASATSYGAAGSDCYARGEAIGYPSAFQSHVYSAEC